MSHRPKRRLHIDAPYSDDAVLAIREGLARLARIESDPDIEVRKGGSSPNHILHVEFRLFNMHVQTFPAHKNDQHSLRDFALRLLDPATVWLTDKADKERIDAELLARWGAVQTRLLEQGIDLHRLSGRDGGGWKKPTLDRFGTVTASPFNKVLDHIFESAPRMLWVRIIGGNRKWNLRFGGEEGVALESIQLDPIQRLRSLAAYA